MSRSRLIPPVLATVLVALLVLATAAAAEVRSGEAESAVDESIAGEVDVLGASASYDTATGNVTATVTLREPATADPELQLQAALFRSPSGDCSTAGISSASYPAFLIIAPYAEPDGGWISLEHEGEGVTPENSGPASKRVVGTKTTLVAVTPLAVGRPYDCALVGTGEAGEPEAIDYVGFPIAGPQPSTPPPPPATPPAPAPPAPTPATLSIAKPKPLQVKSGEWTTVRVTVSNPGGTATAPGSLRLKGTKGVAVKPGRRKLPALLPGGSWTVSFRVKLNAKAKPKSRLRLIGTAPGLRTTSSLVVKLVG